MTKTKIKIPEPIVHVLKAGTAICGVKAQAGYQWPEGHCWLSEAAASLAPERITCPACRATLADYDCAALEARFAFGSLPEAIQRTPSPTDLARHVVGQVGGGVIGYWSFENFKAIVGRGDDGHDFALLGGRFIVDLWIRDRFPNLCERAVLDREDLGDRALVEKFYGDPKTWQAVEIGNRGHSRATTADGAPATSPAVTLTLQDNDMEYGVWVRIERSLGDEDEFNNLLDNVFLNTFVAANLRRQPDGSFLTYFNAGRQNKAAQLLGELAYRFMRAGFPVTTGLRARHCDACAQPISHHLISFEHELFCPGAERTLLADRLGLPAVWQRDEAQSPKKRRPVDGLSDV
jgi:hypothetical protein